MIEDNLKRLTPTHPTINQKCQLVAMQLCTHINLLTVIGQFGLDHKTCLFKALDT